jgi:hypothetical protein
VATLVARKANEAVVAPMVGSGVWSQAVGFVSMRLAGIFSRRDEVFTFNLLLKDSFLILYFRCDLQR